jgi:hypothetical protein
MKQIIVIINHYLDNTCTGRLFISLFLRVMAKVRDLEAKFPVRKGHYSL